MGAHLYVSLTLFILIEYISSAVCQTIEFPVGVFMPVFMVGAAFGRLVGESMFAWFPQGFKNQNIIRQCITWVKKEESIQFLTTEIKSINKFKWNAYNYQKISMLGLE